MATTKVTLGKRARNNITRLADFLESKRYRFDMEEPYADPKCGTAGCVGGHAAVLWPDVCYPSPMGDEVTFDDLKLAKKLGLDDDVVEELCYNPKSLAGRVLSLRRITRAKAVATLRRLADTGELYF